MVWPVLHQRLLVEAGEAAVHPEAVILMSATFPDPPKIPCRPELLPALHLCYLCSQVGSL